MNPATMLKELINAIEEGDKEKVKEKINWFLQDLSRIKQMYKSQCVTETDLILVACRNKQDDILRYLLNETDILDYLPGADYKDTEVKRQRTEAFKHALIWDAFPMVEMLYDYWSGNLHWIGHNINKIESLGTLLDDARVVCVVETQQLQIDIHSLIKFNAFQKELYSSISNTTLGDTASKLVEMLRIYDEYSKIEKVRIPNEDVEQENAVQANFKDETSEYMKGMQAYITYEFYYRKLDFNVALLILDNSFVLRKYLKERFNQPKIFFAANPGLKSSYEDAVISYKKIECALYHFIYCTCEDWRLYLPRDRQIKIKEYELHNGPVLFLERKNFKKCVNDLKVLLQDHVKSVDPAKAWAQNQTENIEILLDDNYLTPTMYMSDYYSLSKIVFYIQAIENSRGINVLVIERILQVTGEMLKSTLATYHLSESAKSLLQISVDIDTIKYLHDIRTFLSKTDEGQLSTRIEIAKNQPQIFHDIKKDLEIIRQMINSVLDVYKHILDKSLLNEGLDLLDEQIKKMAILKHIDVIDRCYAKDGDKLIESETCEPLLQKLSDHTKLTVQLLKEYFWIRLNKEAITSKIKSAETIIGEWIVSVLPTYIGNIKETLKFVSKDHKNSKFDDHWKAIIRVLSFFFDEFKLLGPKPQIIKDLCLSFDEYKRMKKKPEIIKDVSSITNILDDLEKKWGSSSTCKNAFVGIEKLHAIAKKKRQKKDQPRNKLISCLISRVNQLKVTLQYPQPRPREEYIRKYKHDKTFRFVIEMIVADIANVLAQCNKKSGQDRTKEITKKLDKFLRDIDLGNLLDHGNPFLDVIVDVFDSYDLSTALVSKAIMFAEDGESIEALFKLFQDNIHYDTIKNGKLENMDDGQKTLYKLFQKSTNWEIYVELVSENPN